MLLVDEQPGAPEREEHLMSESVVIKSGEVVHFPVASDHPLAKYQQQVDTSKRNIHDLAVVRKMISVHPKASTDQITKALDDILASSNGTILQLALPDITVQEGATMVCGGPVTAITAGNVTVLGEILAYGSLNLTCSTLSGVVIAPPVISSISPSTGSTLGGTQVQIQGSGFDATMPVAVYFGGTPATNFRVIVGETGVCIATAPPAANTGPVNITMRTYGVYSSSTSSADVFTYVYIPGVASINVNSNVLWTGDSSSGTVTLNELAASEGATATLSDFHSNTVPASVFINAGGTSATFPITVPADFAGGSLTISATGPDGTSRSALVEVFAGQIALSLNVPEPFVSGGTATGMIFVRTPAPASGALITLNANKPNAIGIPATVPLLGGSSSATFTLTALPGPFTPDVTVSANYAGNSSTSAAFAVNPPRVSRPGPGPGPTPI
jgi:hypothetical protein